MFCRAFGQSFPFFLSLILTATSLPLKAEEGEAYDELISAIDQIERVSTCVVSAEDQSSELLICESVSGALYAIPIQSEQPAPAEIRLTPNFRPERITPQRRFGSLVN